MAGWLLSIGVPASAQSLIDGAKKEGQVVFYASMEAASAQRITASFEKKFPFIKVDATRIGSERMATRLVAEAQAPKFAPMSCNNRRSIFTAFFRKDFSKATSRRSALHFQGSTATRKVFG